MMPLPRKPTPITTAWIARSGSYCRFPRVGVPPVKVSTVCSPSATKKAALMQTSMCVRRPADLPAVSRSKPTAAPSSAAASRRSRIERSGPIALMTTGG